MLPGNVVILNPVTAAASINSGPIWATKMLRCSIQFVATGTAAGNFQLQASNDQNTGLPNDNFVPSHWNNIGSPVTVSGAGSYLAPFIELSYEYLRLVYTDTSGGTASLLISARICSRGA